MKKTLSIIAIVVGALLSTFAGENRLVVVQDGTTYTLPASSVTNLGGLSVLAALTGSSINAATVNSNSIVAGTCTAATDGTVTNTFTTAFSAAPRVVITQTGTVNSATNIITTITSSNFVWAPNKASVVGNWIALGAQ